LIPRYRITGIIITTALRPDTMAALEELAGQHRVSLSEWRFETRELDIPPSQASHLRPANSIGLNS
jgi:hypothetical protein